MLPTSGTHHSADFSKYIEGELAEKLGLKDIHRVPTFLTRENYVSLKELLWFNDSHDYVHEGYRVDNSTLLDTHASTSARLKEVCQAKYLVRAKLMEVIRVRAADVSIGYSLPGRMERRRTGNQVE